MRMNNGLLPLVLLFIGFSASAQTLVVSDIDDTIKISHVLDLDGAALNLPRVDNHFMGMAEAYQSLKDQNQQVQFAYVSNALVQVSKVFHELFLSINNFPDPNLYLRDNILENNFKVLTIRQLIADTNPKEIIMIGDNGEKDIEVYEQIKKEYPQLKTRIYIHLVYTKNKNEEVGKVPRPGQKTFVTSADLLALWMKEGLVNQTRFQNFLSQIMPKIVAEDQSEASGEMAFPNWMDCRDYFGVGSVTHSWTDTLDKLISKIEFWKPKQIPPEKLWEAYQQILFKRCSVEAVKQ